MLPIFAKQYNEEEQDQTCAYVSKTLREDSHFSIPDRVREVSWSSGQTKNGMQQVAWTCRNTIVRQTSINLGLSDGQNSIPIHQNPIMLRMGRNLSSTVNYNDVLIKCTYHISKALGPAKWPLSWVRDFQAISQSKGKNKSRFLFIIIKPFTKEPYNTL